MKTLSWKLVRQEVIEEIPDAAAEMRYAVVTRPVVTRPDEKTNAPITVVAMFRMESDAEFFIEERLKDSWKFEIREILK